MERVLTLQNTRMSILAKKQAFFINFDACAFFEFFYFKRFVLTKWSHFGIIKKWQVRRPQFNNQKETTMSDWKKFTVNSNAIHQDTGRAVLIKVPNSEFKFWHPSKLVRQYGKKGYHTTVSYTDSFEFKVFRNGKGRYNSREKIEEQTLTASQMEELMNVG